MQRESWFAAYADIIAPEVIDRVTLPDNGARVRQSFRTRPRQRMLLAADTAATGPDATRPAATRPAATGPDAAGPDASEVVGYALYGPETDVLNAPWPHPLTADGAGGRVAELYALYVRPAWWSTGTGRALMERVLARTGAAGYQAITLWVLRDNERARRFYERAGFTPDGATNVLAGLGDILEVRYRRPLSWTYN